MFFLAIDNNLSKSLTKSADLNSAKIVMLKSLLGGLILFAVTLSTGTDLYIEIELLPIIIISVFWLWWGVISVFRRSEAHRNSKDNGCVLINANIWNHNRSNSSQRISVFQAIATGLIILGIFTISRH
jgi:hypothetical protein